MRSALGNRRLLRRASAVVLCALAAAGCGSSAEGTAGTATVQQGGGPTVNRTGVRAEEARNALHLSRRDCDSLGATLTKREGHTIRISSEPRPPRSDCQLRARGLDVTVTLDTSYGAHRRYFNRVTETEQFGAPDPAKMPHPVPGVGEPGVYGQSANWIPAIGSLLAVRGNRWITVNYAAGGEPPPVRQAAASAVARQAFRLSAR